MIIKFVQIVVIIITLAPSMSSASSVPEEDLAGLKSDLEALKEGQKWLDKDIQELKILLQKILTGPKERYDSFTNLSIDITSDPSKGANRAKVAIIEFSDYQCPFCRRHFTHTLPLLEKEYIKTGKVKYYFKDFPLENIHEEAFSVAKAASCAGEQKKYWEMHDKLFSSQNSFTMHTLKDYVKDLGIEDKSFYGCFNSKRKEEEIRRDMNIGQKIGVRGTPTFFIGINKENSSELKAKNILRGANSFSKFKKIIDNLLEES